MKKLTLLSRANASMIVAAALLLSSTAPVQAVDESGGIQSRRGDRSPSVLESNVNEYTFQDEQVNLGPDDQDVLVLRSDEKVLLNRFVTANFPLKNVTPREIRNVMRELTAKEGGRAEVIRDKKTGENFLQVIAPKWQIAFIAETIEALDQEWLQQRRDGSESAYYKARHRSIVDLDALASQWGGEGFSTFDLANNAALRVDEPYRVEKYQAALELVDIPEHQARFDVKIYEVDTNNDLRIGLDYIAWKNGPGRNLFNFGAAGYDMKERTEDVASLLNPFFSPVRSVGAEQTTRARARFASFSSFITAAYVDFLSVKGRARLLNQGTVQVRSGETGTFQAVDQVLSFDIEHVEYTNRYVVVDGDVILLEADPAEGVSGSPPPSSGPGDQSGQAETLAGFDRTLKFEQTGEVGLFLEISPVVLSDSVEAEITVEQSEVSGYTPQGLPIINDSLTVTKARMQDGSTLVLSGLKRSEKIESRTGAPVLSDIPGLGYLFGSDNNANRERELLIVIECQSETGGAVALENPEEISTIALQTHEGTPPAIPGNAFGFDQWLLDGRSGGQ